MNFPPLLTHLIMIGFSFMAFEAGAEGPLVFECNFSKRSTEYELSTTDRLELKYLLDTNTGKAILVGNNGLADVEVIPGEFGITFLEILKTGAVQSTTILVETAKAIHSRHTMTGPETLLASQHYGACLLQ